MEDKDLEKRICLRFEVPGTTVSYTSNKIFKAANKYEEEFCPVLDMSRGGLRFICQTALKIDSKLSLEVSVPGERTRLQLKGKVIWAAVNPGKSYKYQIGVQFNTYGEKKGQNYPGTLVKIIELEQKFAQDTAKKDGSKIEEYETEG
jgi:Tfp pilus assembly protein PilZ